MNQGDPMKILDNEYVLNKIKNFLKEYYFRESLRGKNPAQMTKNEIIEFTELHGLTNTILVLINKYEDLLSQLNEKISKNIPNECKLILHTLYLESKNSYIVGGCVRDSILGVEPKDFDFVTDIPYDRLKEVFSTNDCRYKELGKQFLVFNLVYKGKEYEIANFRKDGTYIDGRRPESVNIGSIHDDMQRRDFTVNALYWNPDGIYGATQSIDDIDLKILRFIGKPEERLKEDYLRGWRFYRFIKTKNLTPNKKSLKAVRTYMDKMMACSPSRVQNEIEKIIGV